MVDASKNLYCPGMTPQALATKVLNDRFREGMPSLPIDPFKPDARIWNRVSAYGV